MKRSPLARDALGPAAIACLVGLLGFALSFGTYGNSQSAVYRQSSSANDAHSCFWGKSRSIVRSWASVNADRDGRKDRFGVCVDVGEQLRGKASAAFYETKTADGRVFDLAVPIADGIAGVTDIDRDDVSEVWVVQNGATAHHMGLVTFLDGAPVEADRPSGAEFSPLLYGVTGPSALTTSVGIECADVTGDGALDVIAEENERSIDSPRVWVRGSLRAYTFDGRRLHRAFRTDAALLKERLQQVLELRGGLACDGVVYPSLT